MTTVELNENRGVLRRDAPGGRDGPNVIGVTGVRSPGFTLEGGFAF